MLLAVWVPELETQSEVLIPSLAAIAVSAIIGFTVQDRELARNSTPILGIEETVPESLISDPAKTP